MSQTANGKSAYKIYSEVLNMSFHDSTSIPEWGDLSDIQKIAFQEVANNAGTCLSIGQSVRTDIGAQGKVMAITISKGRKVGVWIEGLDSTGRSFETHAYIDEITALE